MPNVQVDCDFVKNNLIAIGYKENEIQTFIDDDVDNLDLTGEEYTRIKGKV